MYQQRLQKLVAKMKQDGITNYIVSDVLSIYYFTGYKVDPGERLLALNISSDNKHQFIVNALFPLPQLSEEIKQVFQIEVFKDGEPIMERVANHLGKGPIGIDKFWASGFLIELMNLAPNLSYVDGSYLVDEMRAVKSPEEIQWMKESSKLNDQAMEQVVKLLEKRLPETQMVEKLGEIYQQLGADGFSFPPIIAYGANGANPHHETNEDQPKLGDSIVIDMGAYYKDYASDMTRTVFYGEPSEEALKVYDTVKRANEAAIKAVKPGVPYSEIDQAARQIIEEAGYGEYFTHRTGHFIGLDVHEAGDVSEHNPELTQVGHIFSIEPGIYLPGKLGVRIEDLVVVTEDGCDVLNHFTKEPIILNTNS